VKAAVLRWENFRENFGQCYLCPGTSGLAQAQVVFYMLWIWQQNILKAFVGAILCLAHKLFVNLSKDFWKNGKETVRMKFRFLGRLVSEEPVV
jgi:hypothetical protein